MMPIVVKHLTATLKLIKLILSHDSRHTDNRCSDYLDAFSFILECPVGKTLDLSH